jgi:tRNA modification GTPase
MERRTTIFALSSAKGRAGICVFRVSGPATRAAVEALTGAPVPAARLAALRDVRMEDGTLIDRGLVLWFAGPHSFTGEDVAEFHLHGGAAVIGAVTRRLGELPDLRPADAGEFTRRAFMAGKLDLTEAEGLADLINAETEQQRRLALRQLQGGLKEQYERWRGELVRALAHLEATIDFVDEELPDDLAKSVRPRIAKLRTEIGTHLDDDRRGEIVRDGFTVVILGAPNVGKSSLLNALARRDVAIVSSVPGTTRDTIEVDLDLGGYAVTLIDTAGLRDTTDAIESEGIRRARAKAQHADVRLGVIDAAASPIDSRVSRELSEGDAVVLNKCDAVSPAAQTVAAPLHQMRISAKTGAGIDELLAWLERKSWRAPVVRSMPMTRACHREALVDARAALARFDKAKASTSRLKISASRAHSAVSPVASTSKTCWT